MVWPAASCPLLDDLTCYLYCEKILSRRPGTSFWPVIYKWNRLNNERTKKANDMRHDIIIDGRYRALLSIWCQHWVQIYSKRWFVSDSLATFRRLNGHLLPHCVFAQNMVYWSTYYFSALCCDKFRRWVHFWGTENEYWNLSILLMGIIQNTFTAMGTEHIQINVKKRTLCANSAKLGRWQSSQVNFAIPHSIRRQHVWDEHESVNWIDRAYASNGHRASEDDARIQWFVHQIWHGCYISIMVFRLND